MQTKDLIKVVLLILVIGASCAAIVALGAQALSSGYARQTAVKVEKAGIADVKPAQRVSPDRAASPNDALVAHESWKRSPSLTDF
jgi:hypothetical protein